MVSYSEKLKDPRWQKKRLFILERDGWKCRLCMSGLSELQVHHIYYEPNKEPWDYPDNTLLTLCVNCHNQEKEIKTETERKLIFALRKLKFTNVDLSELHSMLEDFTDADYDPYDIISVFHLTLLKPEVFDKLLNDYYDWPL